MRREQGLQARRIAAAHSAFGADAVDARMPARRSKPRGVARRIGMVNEAEIELRSIA
jgi:hypothetical protein